MALCGATVVFILFVRCMGPGFESLSNYVLLYLSLFLCVAPASSQSNLLTLEESTLISVPTNVTMIVAWSYLAIYML